MQQGQSPPKHRHDGTSPLPLGMDWSPPPRKWKLIARIQNLMKGSNMLPYVVSVNQLEHNKLKSGKDTVWPHDPRSGWSYCITIPSWVVLPKSRDSDPVVFYRVQVGLQSPEGVTTTRGVLRRFNDFLKLYNALRKALPRKNLPPAPPKGLLRLKSRALLEERRCSLEEWMTKLLSDIDISRSVVVASFLELEVTARSSFLDENQRTAQANLAGNSAVSSSKVYPSSSQPVLAASSSFMSDYGSDTGYEASDIGTPSIGRDNSSEVGTEDLSLDEDLTGPIEKLMKYGMSNIDEGLFMGHAILEQLESLPRHSGNTSKFNKITESSTNNGNASNAAYLVEETMESLSEAEHGKAIGHARKLSNGSVGSEVSSIRGSETSTSGFPSIYADGSLDLTRGAEASKTMEILGNMESQYLNNVQLVLPFDQQQKMNRVLMSMQRRLVTAKTDMEDLLSRLNQEIAVKDYLTTKVKDLEVELETTKQKSKENLQQAMLIERERLTQMQWDMEELRRKSLEMEFKLKSQQGEKMDTESPKVTMVQGKDVLLQELDTTIQQLEDLRRKHQEFEMKSKADIKVLVKEVKSLRGSQAELKQQLSKSLAGKSEAEKLLQQVKQSKEKENVARKKLLHECEILHNRLRECNVNLLNGAEDKLVLNSSSIQDALDLLEISDNRIEILLAEAQLLAQEDNRGISVDGISNVDDDSGIMDHEVRKMLSNILIENVVLRKQLNSVIRHALKMGLLSKKNDETPRDQTVKKKKNTSL